MAMAATITPRMTTMRRRMELQSWWHRHSCLCTWSTDRNVCATILRAQQVDCAIDDRIRAGPDQQEHRFARQPLSRVRKEQGGSLVQRDRGMRDAQGEVIALPAQERNGRRVRARCAGGDDSRVQLLDLRRESLSQRAAAIGIVLADQIEGSPAMSQRQKRL